MFLQQMRVLKTMRKGRMPMNLQKGKETHLQYLRKFNLSLSTSSKCLVERGKRKKSSERSTSLL